MIHVKSPADKILTMIIKNVKHTSMTVLDSDVWADCPCFRLPLPSLQLFSASGGKIKCHKTILFAISTYSQCDQCIHHYLVCVRSMCVHICPVQAALITSFHVMTPHSCPFSVINRRCSPVTLMIQWAWQNTHKHAHTRGTPQQKQTHNVKETEVSHQFILTAPALRCFQESDVAVQVE